jgi:hypothetical protein
MRLNWKLKALVVLPFIFIIVAVVLASKLDVKYKMTQEEQEILGFEVTDARIAEGKKVTERLLQVPTLIEKIMGQRSAPKVKGGQQQKKKEEVKLLVTMIIVSEKGSMAIVNNIVVKEGDSILGQKILKIEGNRILVEFTKEPDPNSKTKTITKGTKWVNLS